MDLIERVAARFQTADAKTADDLPEWIFGPSGHKLMQECAKAVEHVIKSKCGVELHLYNITHPTDTEYQAFGFDESSGHGGKTIHGRFVLKFDMSGSGPSDRNPDVEVGYMPWNPKSGRLESSEYVSEGTNAGQGQILHACTALAEKVCAKVHAQMKANAEAASKGKRKLEADVYHVAARHLAELVADQNKAAPKKVDDLFKEVKDGNPDYSDEQAWATAWSIYCKHVDPNGEHCHKGPGGYLKEASEAEKVRSYLAKSIKHMKDITGPKWEKFAKENPGLAAASVHMAAQDAVRAMEEADKLLARMPKMADAEAGHYRSYPRDPHWMNARYPGVGADGTPFKAGDKVLYWPNTKTVMVGKQAEDAWRRFEAEAADEAMYGGNRAAQVQAEVSRPTPLAGQEGSIERPTPSATEEAPDEHGWNPWEKRGEWNLTIYHPGGRRNLSYFMKNPSGGGGGSNDGTSVSALIKMVIHQTGWAVPHINPHKKDKVWVSVVQAEGETDWKAIKQYWEPVPKELLVPKMPRQLTKEEQMDLLTR